MSGEASICCSHNANMGQGNRRQRVEWKWAGDRFFYS